MVFLDPGLEGGTGTRPPGGANPSHESGWFFPPLPLRPPLPTGTTVPGSGGAPFFFQEKTGRSA